LRTGESLILIVRSVAAIVYAIPVRHLSTYVGRRCVFIVTGLLRLVLLPLCFIGIAGAADFSERAPPAPACPGASTSPSVGSCRPSSRPRPPTTDSLPNVLAVFPGAISLVFLIGAFIAPETKRNPP
jgi:MHS family proline/betaine transporter-like MFS transporter